MYERFTDRARKVMQLANQEAQRLNHEYIGTEHILLGILRERGGVAVQALKNLELDLRRISREIEKLVLPGPDMVSMGKLPQTPRAKKVIEDAIEEARILKHNHVGTEHLLLGLVREEEGVAAQVLRNLLGLKLNDVRKEVLGLLGQEIIPDKDTDGRQQADVPIVHDLKAGLQYLPDEAKRLLKEINDRLAQLTQDKERAVAQQDFKEAVLLRDQADKIKRRLLDALRKLQFPDPGLGG
jgi:ATP-dependent Clp protease ATP-binding subunit ClpA